MFTEAKWRTVLTRCSAGAAVLALWPRVLAEGIKNDTFSKGPVEVPDFMGNILHESGRLAKLEEDLNYSAPRIRELGRLNGPRSRWATAANQADALAGRPYALAETIYGGRFGNANVGDGWRYRGRGPIGLTFFDNYARVGELVGQDLTSVPDLAAQPRFALDIAVAWWEDKIPDSMIGNEELVRRVVNGSALGLKEVQNYSEIVREVLL